jgi:hypothetical protein
MLVEGEVSDEFKTIEEVDTTVAVATRTNIKDTYLKFFKYERL